MRVRTRLRRRAGTACAVMLVPWLAACGGSDDPFSDGCVARIRYQGDAYSEVGFSSLAVKRAGTATVVACARRGATTTPVWSFPGRDPHDVLAVHLHGKVYRVLVAERLPDSFTDELHAAHVLNAGTD